MQDRNNYNSYFEFDDTHREVIIKRYDTPTPWMNYLSNGVFHTMMSQAGGAVAFYKSPQIWRINRYRFFHLPQDRSGMYLYLRDKKTGKYWSPTNEPVAQKPDKWQAAHGMGYTRFIASYDNIEANLTYFVPPDSNALVWRIAITNHGQQACLLDLFAFVEFGMMEFLREVSWVCYMKHQMTVYYNSQQESVVFKYGVENQPKPDETPLVFLSSDKPIKGFDGDRDEFIGNYRSESNPYVIENGDCTGSQLLGGDPCGALQMSVKLQPGQTEHINVFLGCAMNDDEIARMLVRLRTKNYTENAFVNVKDNWEKYFNGFQCAIPDESAQRMVNTWNPYQAQRNFLFSRNISYYATGTFRGVGFRDTSQDILSQTSLDIEQSKEKTRLLLGQQYADGHANHYFFPYEGWDPVTSVHSDDHLWPVMAVWNIVAETGSLDFLFEVLPYYDKGKASVYEHLCQAIAFTLNNLGTNGLPLMLRSDWNDQMFKVCREGKGESFWTSMMLGVVLPMMKQMAELLGKTKDVKQFQKLYEEQKSIVNAIGWDGEWYRRAIMDNGLFLGTSDNEEARLWLNAQSWAVLAAYAPPDRAIQCMNMVSEKLDSDLGLKLIDPPVTTFPDPKDPLTQYNKGTGENAAIFCHANTWAIIAECMLGRGDRAWKYYRQLIPNVAMKQAGPWRYKAEPYVYASNLFGPDSDKFGLANVSWLTGTASWMYVAVTQHILGVQPTWEGLRIDPCLPPDWESIDISRLFRGVKYHIKIRKEKGISKGKAQLNVDGNPVDGHIVPHTDKKNDVLVEIIIKSL